SSHFSLPLYSSGIGDLTGLPEFLNGYWHRLSLSFSFFFICRISFFASALAVVSGCHRSAMFRSSRILSGHLFGRPTFLSIPPLLRLRLALPKAEPRPPLHQLPPLLQ